MIFSTLVTPAAGRSGKILASTLLGGGLLLALIAMRFRVFTPIPGDPATQPATLPVNQPATLPADDAL